MDHSDYHCYHYSQHVWCRYVDVIIFKYPELISKVVQVFMEKQNLYLHPSRLSLLSACLFLDLFLISEEDQITIASGSAIGNALGPLLSMLAFQEPKAGSSLGGVL